MSGESRQQFALRQAAALAAEGMERDRIERRLKEELGVDLAATPAEGRHPMLDRLVLEARNSRIDGSRLHNELLERVSGSGQLFAQILRSVATVQTYALGVAAIATVIWFIWLTYVAPSFLELYAAMGSELPSMTRVFANPVTGGIVLALVWLTVGFLWWCNARLRAVMTTLLQPPAILRGLPAIAGLLHSYLDWLSVQALAALGAGSSNRLELVDRWRGAIGFAPLSRSSDPDLALGDALDSADRLGTLDQELDWQSQRLEAEFPVRAAHLREWLMILLLVVFGLAIGAMVISMYLPIFRLAAVI